MSDDTLNDPAAPADPTAAPASPVPSIVDTILDLDALLSGDVRRARKSVRISTKPWLEADLDALDDELDSLTDDRGDSLDDDEALAGDRTAAVVARERHTVQREYAASMQRVDVEQMPEPEWRAWFKANQQALDAEDTPAEVYDDLISRCAVAPRMPLEKLAKFRAAVGHPQVAKLARAAWAVNTQSGVDVPKSQLSSHVLKRQGPARS